MKVEDRRKALSRCTSGLRVERGSIFGVKMGVGRGKRDFFWGISVLIFVFGLKTGILGGAFGHLVFGKDGDIWG